MKETKKRGLLLSDSDELTEVIGMSDRLIVMKDGRVQTVLRRDENFTEHAVIEVMI
jgi:ribose transport system ATP-binding protein